jgi:hypothetical protein
MADATLFGKAAPAVATEAVKKQALERELGFRRRIYPDLVRKGSLTPAEAQHEIWVIERILAEGYRP